MNAKPKKDVENDVYYFRTVFSTVLILLFCFVFVIYQLTLYTYLRRCISIYFKIDEFIEPKYFTRPEK